MNIFFKKLVETFLVWIQIQNQYTAQFLCANQLIEQNTWGNSSSDILFKHPFN